MAKYGIREICDVVFKAKADNQSIGSKKFKKGQPVIYFDSLKTSSLEGAATTVYATGGKGNPRLVAWDGERTLTFNMEDALISPMGLAILAGAGLTEATSEAPVYRHLTERVKIAEASGTTGSANLTKAAYEEGAVWYGKLDENGNLVGEMIKVDPAEDPEGDIIAGNKITIPGAKKDDFYLVDYYTKEITSGTTQIDIDPSKFAGSFYIEGSTLWRDEDGQDHPVEIVIPNGKVQSNFTFNMSSSGDPSTFNFVVDALADYTAFDKSHKVLAAMQVMAEIESK